MKNDDRKSTTTDAGIPVASDEFSLTVGPDGPILLQDHYLIEQMAKIVGISPDVLYFHANRHPADVKADVDQERVEAAFRAFRKALGVKPAGKRK